MGRKSSIRKLPPKLRDELDAMVRDGRLTIDAITEFVRSAGAPVSRSAVGRYVKNYEEQIADYRKTQELAKVLVGELSDNPQGDVGRLASELLKLQVLRGLESLRAEGKELPPEQTMLLSAALRNAGSFDKSNADLVLRLKKELATQAADAATKVGRKSGLSADSVAEIRAAILGISK